jgi:two-component system sensor histidine kinase PilS (NtrC family)
MITASSCSILYGLLIDLHYYRVIEPLGSRLASPADYQSSYIFYMILVNIVAFYLVAFLSSYPSEQARKSRVELKAKQQDIIKLEALNEWIIRSMTSGLITLDDQERILLFNPAAEALLGIPIAACAGQRLLEVLPFLKGHTGSGDNPLNPYAMKHQNYIDLPYLKPSGEKVFLRYSVSPLRLPEGKEGGKILFFQDMTQMREIEEEMKRVEGLALIGELAAGIAHEIRNPMASISGSIQMLKESL